MEPVINAFFGIFSPAIVVKSNIPTQKRKTNGPKHDQKSNNNRKKNIAKKIKDINNSNGGSFLITELWKHD